MLRTVLSVLAGVVVAVLLVFVMEKVGHYVFPPPPDVDFGDPESLKTLAGRMPFGALLSVILAYGVGAFTGGTVAIHLSRLHVAWPAWVVAGVVLLFAVLTMLSFPHPVWFMVMAVLVIPAAGYGAGWVVLRPHAPPPASA